MSLHKPIATVVYAPIRDVDISVPLYPKSRYDEVLGCKDPASGKEKYLVWKLLEKAVRESLNLEFANLEFTKTENGQWICPDFYFSLSHADGIVCVALSDEPIGIDAEPVKEIRPQLEGRILTDREREQIKNATDEERSEYLLCAWVKKESIFKKSGGKALLPNRIDPAEHKTQLRRVLSDGREYIIAVCQDRNIEIEFNFVEEI